MNQRLVLKVLLVLFFQGCCWSLFAAEGASGVSVIEQQTGFVRYSGSSIDQYQTMSVRDHPLVTGALKTVNGLMKFDDVQRVSGDLHQITYRIPEGYSSREAFKYYRERVAKAGGQVLYECQSRTCGASNLWANRVFKVAELYGPDQYQQYLTATLLISERVYYVAIYSIQRGNRRVYLHLDLIEQDDAGLSEVAINPQIVLDSLRQNGRWILEGLQFDQNNQLKTQTPAVVALLGAMEKDVRLMVYLVGHLGAVSGSAIDKSIAQSRARAESVKLSLTEAGLAAERIEVHGVGPLAPFKSDGQGSDRIEAVLKLR